MDATDRGNSGNIRGAKEVRDVDLRARSERDDGKRRGRSSKISRERILEAALVEFAENGYEGATTASVARRVKVTQPLIHYHFGSKEALWRAAVELAFARMSSVLQGIEEDMAHVSPEESVRVMARRFVYFNAKYPEVTRLVIAEAATRSPRLEWMAEKHLRPVFDQLAMLFDTGMRSGLLKQLPVHNLLFAFLGAVPHFFDSAPLIKILYGIDPQSEEHVAAHAETLVELFTSGLIAPEHKEA